MAEIRFAILVLDAVFARNLGKDISAIKNRASTCGGEGEEEDEVLFAYKKKQAIISENLKTKKH